MQSFKLTTTHRDGIKPIIRPPANRSVAHGKVSLHSRGRDQGRFDSTPVGPATHQGEAHQVDSHVIGKNGDAIAAADGQIGGDVIGAWVSDRERQRWNEDPWLYLVQS